MTITWFGMAYFTIKHCTYITTKHKKHNFIKRFDFLDNKGLDCRTSYCYVDFCLATVFWSYDFFNKMNDFPAESLRVSCEILAGLLWLLVL